jgi:hypothetical protein
VAEAQYRVDARRLVRRGAIVPRQALQRPIADHPGGSGATASF